MPISTGDTLFPDITEPPLFWSSKLIHLVDCRKVEEEGIIQHRQLHPDTLLSTTSPRESPIVGYCVRVCVRGCTPLWSSWERGGGAPFYGAIGRRVYVSCVCAW